MGSRRVCPIHYFLKFFLVFFHIKMLLQLISTFLNGIYSFFENLLPVLNFFKLILWNGNVCTRKSLLLHLKNFLNILNDGLISHWRSSFDFSWIKRFSLSSSLITIALRELSIIFKSSFNKFGLLLQFFINFHAWHHFCLINLSFFDHGHHILIDIVIKNQYHLKVMLWQR